GTLSSARWIQTLEQVVPLGDLTVSVISHVRGFSPIADWSTSTLRMALPLDGGISTNTAGGSRWMTSTGSDLPLSVQIPRVSPRTISDTNFQAWLLRLTQPGRPWLSSRAATFTVSPQRS